MNEKNTKYQKTRKLLLLTHLMLTGLLTTLFWILSFLFFDDLCLTVFGILMGGVGGVILILLMAYSIEKALDHDPQTAQKYMLKHYLLRTLLMLGLLFFGVFHSKWTLLGITLGLLCVKMGGFFEPKLEHGLFNIKERRK